MLPKKFEMILLISKNTYLRYTAVFSAVCLLLILKTYQVSGQDLTVTTTISPTLNPPQTVGTVLDYITTVFYNNPSPTSVDAIFSIDPTALSIGNVAIIPTGGTLVIQRVGTTIWDISNMSSGASVTFNYRGTITSTSSSAVNKTSITPTTGFVDIDGSNNVAAIQTFIRPILNPPTAVSICSDVSVNNPLSSDNTLTTYSWSASPSMGSITVQPSATGPLVADVVTNVGTTSGTVAYTVTPALTSAIVEPNGTVSSTLTTTLGSTQSFTVTVQPIGLISGISITNGGTVYYGTDAVFAPSSNLASSIYSWYSNANKTGGPIISNPTGVLTRPFLSIGTHTYYVTAASSGSPFCEGAVYTATVNIIPRPINPPNLFSPDDSGDNDQWVIVNLDQYPYCTVRIFNEQGKDVYTASQGYTNPWDGTFKGKALEAATYYYVIDLKDGSKPFGGSVTIIRKD